MPHLILDLIANPGFIAVSTAIITTIGVKLVESRGRGRELKVDESTALRIELRAEIDSLRQELDKKEIDIEKWREKYYALQEMYNEALNRERIAQADLREALDELNRLRPPNGNQPKT